MSAHDPHLDPQPDWLVEFGLNASHPLVHQHEHVLKSVLGAAYERRLQGPLGLSNFQVLRTETPRLRNPASGN
jgi:hypothetical protein